MYMVINEETINSNFLYPVYNIAEACIEQDIYNGNYDLPTLQAFAEAEAENNIATSKPGGFMSKIKGRLEKMRNDTKMKIGGIKGQLGDILDGVANEKINSGELDHLVLKFVTSHNPNFIQKKIAALRGLYAKWLTKAKIESDLESASFFKEIAAAILRVIDNILRKLQYMGAKKDTVNVPFIYVKPTKPIQNPFY